jgi:hypothetical protein
MGRLGVTGPLCERPLWVKTGRVIGLVKVRYGKQTWAGDKSLQTDLQTNHTAQHGIVHH